MKNRLIQTLLLTIIIIFSFSCVSKSEGLEKKDIKPLINLFLRAHVSENQFNDKISERAFDNFISALDPLKLFFTKADIDEFSKYKNTIDDMYNSGNYDFLNEITTRYKKRFDEKMKLVDTLLQDDYNFDVDEYLITDRDSLTFSNDIKENQDRWRKYIKFQLLNYINVGKDIDDAKEKVEKKYNVIKKDMNKYSDSDMYSSFVNAVAMSLDPHTNYMTPEQNQDFKISMELKLSGIGAILRSEDGFVFVESVIPGGPVSQMPENQALKVNDKIISVAQGDDEPEDIIDIPLRDAVKFIRGKKGTVVKLTVIRTDPKTNKQQHLVIPIVRDEIVLEQSAVKHDVYKDTKGRNIGYINLPSFYSSITASGEDGKSSAKDVKDALLKLKKQNIKALVLDLRGNPGGSLPEAVKIAGYFIKSGPILQVKDSRQVRSYPDIDPEIYYSGPLTVLIDNFSASASEIFAGAMRDYRRALLIGPSPTFGKGSVQTYQDLQNKGALKVTVQIFYQPNGMSNNNVGIKPHITIPSYTQVYDYSESKLKYSLSWVPVPKAEYYTYKNKYISPYTIAVLDKNSKTRRKNSEEYKKLLKDIQNYKKMYDSKKISLKKDSDEDIKKSKELQEKYEAERENGDDSNKPSFDLKKDIMLKESFNITEEYINYVK